MDKLKDCPFCGGEASKPVRSSGSDERNGYNFTVSIFCKCCGVSIRCDSATDAAGWCKDTGQALENAVSAWNRRAAPAQGDAVPVERKPYAYEFGKPNGDGTYSVVIERGDIEQIAPNKYEYVAPKRFAKEHPPIPLFLEQPPANATRQSSADAVDAELIHVATMQEMQDGFGKFPNTIWCEWNKERRRLPTGTKIYAIAAQGGKGEKE